MPPAAHLQVEAEVAPVGPFPVAAVIGHPVPPAVGLVPLEASFPQSFTRSQNPSSLLVSYRLFYFSSVP